MAAVRRFPTDVRSGWKLVRKSTPLVAAPLALMLGWLFGVELCPSRYMGWTCPGCGLGRASIALLSGDVWTAHQAHPLVVPCLVVVGWLYLWAVATVFLPERSAAIDPTRRLPAPIWLGLGLLLLLVWVGRSLAWTGLPPLPA